jgi:hypothetical protein
MRPRIPLNLDKRTRFPKFASSFKSAQATLGLNSKATATLLMVDIATVYTYERGIGRPSLANLGSFEAKLGAKLDMTESGKLAKHDPAATRAKAVAATTVQPAETAATPIATSISATLETLVKAIHAYGFSVELRPLPLVTTASA